MDRRRPRRVFGRWIWFFALAVATLAVAAAFDGLASGPGRDAPLVVSATPVPLDPRHPDADRVGALRYRGGLSLRSGDPRFGGLSDLRVSSDGRALRAVSDCGYGFTAALSYDGEGRLRGLDDPRLVDLSGPDGQPLALGERDAESLVVHGGALEVGFEGKARIWAYALDPPFAGPARLVPSPAGLAGCGSNSGIEAMAMVDDGAPPAGVRGPSPAPRRTSRPGSAAGRAGRSGRYPLLFRDGWAGEPYRATGAALLPGGDAVLVERRFPPIGSRVVRIAKADLDASGPLHPVELATIEPPLTDDNFEGIDARRDEAGRTLLYLVSDDNNCAKRPGGGRGTGLQRTLLLVFSLEE